ncbi:MAG: hypothetical protein R6X35_02540 [Candidatus Krumholzibacteriia bacterium]
MPHLLRVHPHREGPWLVVHGRRRLAVPPELGRRLLDLDGGRPGVPELALRLGGDVTAARALLAPGGRRRSRGPWLRLPLVPARMVRRAAGRLRPLASWPALGVAAVGGVTLVLIGNGTGPLAGLPALAAALSLFLSGAVVHELGHAAALARAGYPPGGIGAGLVAVVPVLWCDVSAVTLLGRGGRVRVALAGPAFQVAFAGILAAMGRVGPEGAAAACGAAAAWSLLAAAWSLLPVFRADGFWLVTDLLGLDDLDRLPRAGDSGRTRLLLGGYRLLHGAFFATAGAAALQRGGRWGYAVGTALLLLVAVRTVRFLRALRAGPAVSA